MIEVRALGSLRYAEALAIQQHTHATVTKQAAPGEGVVFVVEHPPVVTMGKRFLPQDMVLSESDLRLRGIDYHHIDRGGSVTVHEPGQAVVYPVVKLDGVKLGVRRFVGCLEDAMIAVCAEYGIASGRDEVNPGVWVGRDKIGAVGIRVKDGVTMHGLAFNVTNSLATFATIIPCGLQGRGVTSLAAQLRCSDRDVGAPLSASSIGLRIAALVVKNISEALNA